MIGSKFDDKYLGALFVAIVISILFLPDVVISSKWPSFHFVDFLMPFVFLAVLKKGGIKKWIEYGVLIFAFISIIFISIAFNDRLCHYRDYFEILKVAKFGVLAIFASLSIRYVNLNKLLNYSFLILVGINLIQYFELFNINYVLKEIYGFEKEVTFFGKNTIGQPASKRMIGLMGNPNNNAIIFLFFTTWYYNPSLSLRKSWQLYLSVLMVFMCQSKTAIIALLVIMLIGYGIMSKIKYNINFKAILSKIGVLILIFGLSFLLDLDYLIDSFREGVDFLINNKYKSTGSGAMSTKGRWEIWTFLFEMILNKPLIGHGPYKEFFYQRDLFSENEYILVWWRYGIFGLLSFISILVYPIVIALKNLNNKFALPLILYTLVIMVSALTNNPMLNRDIQALYALLLGGFFSNDIWLLKADRFIKD
ncbi:MAG: hypothetical protein CMC96_12920 [Flavobacteriales bacterium]|nr:hypothetical protein [Flavobacteriales bacterium]|tara:strand:- start:26929 stop:28194 length:1266 start_codon:yes stop_codon:yes gene_type:complete